MSDSLPSSVVKATKGEYEIPIKRLWIETWRQLLHMPKVFWQAFGLMLLVLLGMTLLMGLLLQQYDLELLHFQNHQAQLPNLHTLHALNKLKMLLGNFAITVIEILRFLLTVSFAFLALNHIRNQPIKATMIFEWVKALFSLLLISILFSLFYAAMFYASGFYFKALYGFAHSYPGKLIFLLGYILRLIIITVLHTYILLILFMASLLVLDQKLALKKSLHCAFKTINQHWFKNSVLLFLPSLVYMSAWSDSFNLFSGITNGYALLTYLILLPGMILTMLFFLYKKIAAQTNLTPMKKIALIILKVILGLVILELFFSGIGLIWLLPVIALLIAIQYQHIFLDKSLSYV